MYANFVERSVDARLANTTRKSVVMSSLNTAANFPQSALGIVGHLFDEIEAVTASAAELELRGADTDESDDDGEEDEDEDEDPVDNMSFKELLEEIEKLTALPVDEGDDMAGIPSTSQSDSPTYDCPELGSPSYQDKAQAKEKRSYRHRLSKFGFDWGAEKLRSAAKRLYRRGSDSNEPGQPVALEADELKTDESRRVKSVAKVRRGTQSKMKRLIKSIHSRAKNEKNHRCRDDAEPIKSVDVKVIIQWLKWRLEYILQLLHLMEKDKSSVSMNTTKTDHPAVDVPITPSEASP